MGSVLSALALTAPGCSVVEPTFLLKLVSPPGAGTAAGGRKEALS